MKIEWVISEKDVDIVHAFISAQQDSVFVQNRINKCLTNPPSSVSKPTFWQAMVSCLLTTQQRSGPSSPVNRFITAKPFPLSYETCKTQDDLSIFVEKTLRQFGGIRRVARIGDELESNLQVLDGDTWMTIGNRMSTLGHETSANKERETAEFIRNSLDGFGPKQSRNLLQSLGLTRYEIPLDSRITKWLNKFKFPISLSATSLSDPEFYNFIMDGIQTLCRKADVYPCVLDAAIFSSFDDEKWSLDNLVW